MFSTCYFMYAEDVDLCFKARQKGWKTYFLPEATVVHHGGQSSDAADDKHFADVMLRESRFSFFHKHRGGMYSFVYRLTTGCAALCRMTLLRIALLLHAGSRPSLNRALSKWIRIFRWSLGKEQWAKNAK